MNKAMPVFILISLFGALAFGSPLCPKVGGVVQDVHFAAEVNCEMAEDLASVFNSMAKMYGKAPKVTLAIGGVSDNASFDGGGMIRVPYRMVFTSQYGAEYEASSSSLMTCAAHEYGHAIFQQYIKENYKNEFGGIISKLEALSIRSQKILKGEKDESYSADLASVFQGQDYQNYHRLVPYSEFYADVLAVYYRDDKAAIVNALYYEEMTDAEFKVISYRDFNQSLENKDTLHVANEEHVWMAYSRAYVGEKMWPSKSRGAMALSKEIMAAIIDVSKKSLRAPLEEATPERDNLWLIQRLKQKRSAP